jgi:hypothetical protein
VTLVEKNDRLLGYGLVAGEVYQNARLTISLEAHAMGGGEIFNAIARVTRYKEAPVPGVDHTVIYDVLLVESEIRTLLEKLGVEVITESRAVKIESGKGLLTSIVLEDGRMLTADSFVDSTGTAGPAGMCRQYGWGCVSCINRCGVFGGRVSVVTKAGIEEKTALRVGGRPGIPGQGVNIIKDTLDRGLVREIEQKGVILVPVPPGFSEQRFEIPKGDRKILQENLVLVDNGFVKIKSRPCISLHRLRQLPGFRNAIYFDPLGGSRGNCIRFLAVAPRDDTLLVRGTRNLFAAGEKQGLLVGCCEAIVSGLLAGHNAARLACGEDLLTVPRNTAVGEMIAYPSECLNSEPGYSTRYSCIGGELLARIKDKGLYEVNKSAIEERVKEAGLYGIFLN